ncbi:MAG: hypothetical protein RIR16_435 [Actinomycetota bacterium]
MTFNGKDLNLLVALRALLEEANVTKAGERIAVGQSSMSSALARLRVQFGDELLVRIGRNYELTPMARLILPQLQATIPAIETALMTQEDFDPNTTSRRFRIALSDFAGLELKERIERALEQAPNVRIDLVPLPEDAIESGKDLINNDFLVAVPGIGIQGESKLLFKDHYVLMIDRDNPALDGDSISWDAFTQLPHAVCGFGRGHLLPHDRKLAELGFTRKARIKTTSFLPLESVVSGSDMVAIVPSKIFNHLPKSTRVISVPTPFDQVPLIETLWWHPSKNSDVAHVWLRNLLCYDSSE